MLSRMTLASVAGVLALFALAFLSGASANITLNGIVSHTPSMKFHLI